MRPDLHLLLILCLSCLVCLTRGSHGFRGSVEKELIRDLLTQYEFEGKLGRPVIHATDMVTVNFSLSLIQILDVDEKNQILKTNIWYHYKWRDIFLQWTPEKHDNITSIRVPSDKIWLPDILLYNFADDRLKEQRDALVVVEHTGDLLWMPQAILNSSCAFDILFFPFDEQICSLKFGSWTYDGNALNMDFVGGLEQMDMTDYVESNEWDVVENVGQRNVLVYTCCPNMPYPDITFTLRLKRKVAFYTFILILPCGLLSLLTMVIFWVPPESPAKLQLGMNIFLAFFVLLLLLADYTPRAAASIPLIGAYFCLSMIMITLSTVLACVVANMYFRGIRINRAPRWLRSCVIDSAARMFCVHEVLRERRHQPPTTPRKMWSTYVTGVRSQSDPETLVAKTHLLEARSFNRQELRDYGAFQEVTSDFCDPEEPSTSTAFNSYYSASASPSTSDDAMLIDEIATIREMMEEDEAYQESLEEGLRYTQEWRMIACVMDRIFFSFYIAVNFFGLLAMYLRSLFS